MKRLKAIEKFKIIEPFLNGVATLKSIARSVAIPYRTLLRWVVVYKTKGFDQLNAKKREDKCKGRKLSAEVIQLIQAKALEIPKKSLAHIHSEICDYLSEQGMPAPSYSTVRRAVRELPSAALDLQHKGSKFYENTYEMVHRREAKGPNHIWQADHTQLDIIITDERGQKRRPWLTIIIDDYSRAIAGFYLYFEAPSALQRALTLREAIWYKTDSQWLICGIPDILYTDHGSDFTSEHIEIICAQLKIRAIFSAPGKPRGRGRVERFFSTLNQKLISRLPGHTKGQSEAEGLLTIKELEQRIQQFLLDYHNQEHSATKCSPLKPWNQREFMPRMPDSLEQLNLLLLKVAKMRTVQRDGIRFQGFRYTSPVLAAYIQEPVIIRYTPKDLGEIWVYHGGEFVCKAVCQELQSGCFTLKEVLAARRSHKKTLRELIQSRKSIVDSLLGGEVQPMNDATPYEDQPKRPKTSKIKLYENDD